QVTSEAAHEAQPVAQIGRVGVIAGQRGPGHGQFGGDGRRAGRLHEGNEVLEKLRAALELGAQRPADRDVILDRLMQIAHLAPPGHGWAMARNATRSTFAYRFVVARRACRSTWPTSGREAPPANMA